MNKKWILLCLAGMMLYSQPALATPFPDKTDAVIQDAGSYTKANDQKKFTEAIKQLPGTYKVVVVASTQPEAQSPDEYAQKLYDNYNLSEDAMMVVLDMNAEQLGVFAGPALQSKGASMTMLHDKVAAYYEPFRNQKEYLSGIQTFLGEVVAELNRQQSQAQPADNTAADVDAEEKKAETSSWAKLPWWLYAVGAVFAALSVGLIYAMIRRRSIFAQVDDVEDWKDELVEKISVMEMDKPLRRASGKTEEKYMYLADRKENLLRNRIPDVDMMILDAEEACDRFRFKLALGLLDEARETLTSIEQELNELKQDTVKVVATKKESKLAIPEIGKQLEQVERRLSDLRLEYGLSFHELKSGLDEAYAIRARIKEVRADGDDVAAYDLTLKAQKILGKITDAIENMPRWSHRVQKELPEEFRRLEEGISKAAGGGYNLNRSVLDNSLLQAKQLMMAAKAALEEGNLEMVETHVKAFEVLLDATYQSIEEAIMAAREGTGFAQAAAAAYPADAGPIDPDRSGVGLEKPAVASDQEEDDKLMHSKRTKQESGVEEIPSATLEEFEPHAAAASGAAFLEAVMEKTQRDLPPVQEVRADEALFAGSGNELSGAERAVLLNDAVDRKKDSGAPPKRQEPDIDEDEEEYELVIPKMSPAWEEEAEEEPEAERLVIASEDDALDELERISNTLVRIRQQIKRSYLPGVPEHLKYLFEDVVQILARIQAVMESYRYDIEEVSILINDAHDLLLETERLAERTISDCQKAEGAIQYTNRYRRQNRQVNELLAKAEQAFRQLQFAEAFQLAEEARLVVEGEPEEIETGWLLRRKKKG
ncbi:septation ring formation regulator EzrA [Brevibacillus borstelensis]|uniref:septation ring formation regulator EzrA n=1 Tax=Brevibacillus borstelensis TaxID=45462 RepID=UPI0030BD581F